MMLDLALDLAHALDPVAFVQDRLKFEPDPWQAQLLRSQALWILLNCCRQSGKSTTTAALALHTAIYNPGLTLLVSPSLRQSKELFAKVTGFLKDLEPAEVLEEDNKSSCTLANGARVVSLPGDPDTLRGYSAPKLIIKDEAAYVSDAMQAALDPMLAVSKGRLIEMSSPNGKRGHFYENWKEGSMSSGSRSSAANVRGSLRNSWKRRARNWGQRCTARNSRGSLSMRRARLFHPR